MDLSYTQNLEDYHLSLAFAGQVTGRYIDLGAGHPVADNVSCWFYQRGWQGIVVERRSTPGCARAIRLCKRSSVARMASAIFSWSSACTASPPRLSGMPKMPKPLASAIAACDCQS
jgi:hypothetical protein